jgi:arylsulfatase
LREQPGHLIDIMATCVDVSAAVYPTEFNSKAILPMEGRSLAPAFAGNAIERDALYWEHEGNAAVRAGDWKLVRLKAKGAWELYDLKADRTEQHDLAAQMPEKATELSNEWQAWAERCNVLRESNGAPNKGNGKGKNAKRNKAAT